MITIRESGFVEFVGLQNGQPWRIAIAPGDEAAAQRHLNSAELELVMAAWTPELIAAWQQTQEQPTARPEPAEYAGEAVWNADDVDRVTAARISALVAPGLTGDVALLRQLSILRTSISLSRKDATGKADEADRIALAELEALDAQVDALIAEGDAFKKAQGWV